MIGGSILVQLQKVFRHIRGAMATNVSDFLISRLNEWGIRRIFGFPGDGINGIIGAIGRAGDKVNYVQVRHEEMAAFMACAHAKFTGEVGGWQAERRVLRCIGLGFGLGRLG